MKITLIGDSIRQQYAPRVTELLGEDFEVWTPGGENCRFSKYTLRGLFEWAPHMKGSRIVHWNNGLWDTCDVFGDGAFSSEREYVENMLRIADLLLKNHDTVIFATTTPVRRENVYNSNETIDRYNGVIVPLLKERGVIINDLGGAVSRDIYRYIKEDNVHLTEEGIELCARLTVSAITEAASKISGTKIEAEEEKDRTGAPVLI